MKRMIPAVIAITVLAAGQVYADGFELPNMRQMKTMEQSAPAVPLPAQADVLEAPARQKAAAAGAGACAPGYERILSCLAAAKPGDNAIVSAMFEGITVCGRGKQVSLALSAEGRTELAAVDKIVVRAGAVEYQVNEPRFNFIVGSGMAPGVARHATLQLFLGTEPAEAGFSCKK